jgi:hypothetical protein
LGNSQQSKKPSARLNEITQGVNEDDFLNLSGLFVAKFDLAARIDDVRMQFFRRQDIRAIEILTKIFAYSNHWPACQRRKHG